MYPHFQSDQPAPLDGYLPVENARLYYRAIGQGQPILLLHGGPDFDHNYFLPDMDRLSDSFRLIYYDQRGRGKSSGIRINLTKWNWMLRRGEGVERRGEGLYGRPS